MHIKPLAVDHPDRSRVLGDADQIIKDYNHYGFSVINQEFAETIMIAYLTTKKDHDADHQAWVDEGYDVPCAWRF